LVVTNAYLRSALVHRELAWLVDQPSLVSGLLRAGVSFGSVDEPTLVRVVGWLDRLQSLGEEAPTPVQLGLVTCALGELVDTVLDEAAGESWAVGSVVRETMAVLEQHPEHPWTVIELARLAMVSPSSLQRLFKAQVGRSPLEWLRQLRGERAATLLAQSELPIAEIGRRVGWEDPNYMSRRFRMIYGVQPSVYRDRFQAARRAGTRSGLISR
jgi:AraC family L-rhamnose operon transcriptional activator RhaR